MSSEPVRAAAAAHRLLVAASKLPLDELERLARYAEWILAHPLETAPAQVHEDLAP
jgi:hypothetical protein